jgi:hypothetical protein
MFRYGLNAFSSLIPQVSALIPQVSVLKFQNRLKPSKFAASAAVPFVLYVLYVLLIEVL